MAFKSVDELVAMVSKNPGQARRNIQRAQKNNIPVISQDNTGYAKDKKSDIRTNAIKKRAALSSMSKTSTDPSSVEDTRITSKESGYQAIGPKSRRLADAAKARLNSRRKSSTANRAEGKIVTPMLKGRIVKKEEGDHEYR